METNIDRFSERDQGILMQDTGYNVSNRYQVISTMDVINRFSKYGFELDSIEAAGTRSMEKMLKASHMVKLTTDAKMFGGELKPQVIIHNSYDGTKALNIRVGIFRFVCANGIVTGHNLVPNLQILHSNTHWSDMIDDFIDNYEEKYNAQVESITQMKERKMSLDEAYHLAEKALQFRHYDKRIINDAVDPLELLIAKRKEDRGDSAWLRFNVLQESMINGLYRKYDNDGGIKKAKIITNIDEIIRVNVDLSDLFAENM